MHLLRFIVRFIAVALWVLFGIVLLALYYKWSAVATQDRLNRWWSRWLLRLCGVRVRVRGSPPPAGAALVVANHVSWLDIYVLASVRATLFVGKRELRDWPVLGWMIAAVGTIFIERGNRRAVHQVSLAMQERFDRGQLVGLFPEGTTSDGLDLLPFHAGLFEAALRTGVAVQPVALRYLHAGRRSGFAAYTGDESLLGNAWRVLGDGRVEVEVDYAPPLATAPEAPEAASRHALAEAAHRTIRAAVIRPD
ncbi:lysophospholipid acyltransferase family protein [Pigmentiphaga soli]|uniref:1-acyl-sn-glycerol-3-phosphate acyltransferase n=1 Tax=Pigmentiphaga soli TaxID=1007095 RepID=A0ABP8HPA4_9BURK